MRVHLREPQVGRWRGLERAQDFFPADSAGTEFLQQSNGFGRCHALTLPQDYGPVTLEKSVMMMVAEQPVAIGEQIPDDKYV